MKEKDYPGHLDSMKNEAIEANKNIKKIQNECWDMYRNRQDYSKKAKWQSKVTLPEAMGAVRKAQGTIRSSMTRPKEFFNMEGGANPEASGHLKTRMENLFKNPDVNFTTQFVEGIGVSLVFGVGVMKHTFKEKERSFVDVSPVIDEKTGQPMMDENGAPKMKIEKITEKLAMPCFEVKDPRITYFLPNDPYRFQIEEEKYDLEEVLDWKDEEGYDNAQIRKLKQYDYGGSRTDEMEHRMSALDLNEHSNEYRKQVLVQKFYGTVSDKKGEKQHKGKKVTYEIANNKYLIKPPMPLPYWHGRSPYVIWSPIGVVLRKTGQSMLEGMRTIQRAMNNITNLQIDALIYELLGFPQIMTGNLQNPADVNVLTPGYPIRVKSSAQGPAITWDRPTPFGNQSIHMTEQLRRYAQGSHGVTDILQGLPTVKGEQATATEITAKGGESSQIFQVIAMDIEDNCLVPLLEMCASNILQYDDFFDANEPELLQYKNMSREERVAQLKGPFRFTARGITSFFEMQEVLNKINGILGVVAKIPIAAEAIKWPELLNLIFDNSMIPNANTLVYSPEEYAQMQQQKQEQQQQEQQQQMQFSKQQEQAKQQAQMMLQQMKGQGELQEAGLRTQKQLEGKQMDNQAKIMMESIKAKGKDKDSDTKVVTEIIKAKVAGQRGQKK